MMNFSDIPSATILLQSTVLRGLEHSFALLIVRSLTNKIRRKLRAKEKISVQDWDAELEREKQLCCQKRYKRVLNATGIVVHTNLGRSPISTEVANYIKEVVSGYCDLELNIASGKRGGRLAGIRQKLQQLTGAEDALVVNNNAAAVFLCVSVLARGKEVLISRGELVEIGGSFRIPEVIENGGAMLKEVGTTNRTRISDYEKAITENTALILRVHPSNFSIEGFSSRPDRIALAKLAKEKNIPFVEDLGAGLLFSDSTLPWSSDVLAEESIVSALEAGVNLLSCSGDKLLGGSQAGMILGQKEFVEKCLKHPMYRAFRLDKLSLAALEGTLQIYLEGRAKQLPIWQMIDIPLDELKKKAELIAKEFSMATVKRSENYTGGGALPNRSLPSWGVFFDVPDSEALAFFLRSGENPILTRTKNGGVWIEPRTLFAADIPIVIQKLQSWFDGDTVKSV